MSFVQSEGERVNTLHQIIKVQDRVEYLLEKYVETRDSDKLLWLAYNAVFNDLKAHLVNYNMFRAWLLKPKTPVFESLSRARRKIQEEKIELRGQYYSRRQDEAEAIRNHFS
jgi:hypothetical protein